MHSGDMQVLNQNQFQLPGQWRSFIISSMHVTSFWKLTRSHQKQFYLKVLIKLHLDYRNLDKNIPIPLNCVIYTRIACPNQVVKRTLSSSLDYMPISLPTSCVPEVTGYNRLELLEKKMMTLYYSSIPSQKVGQAQLEK